MMEINVEITKRNKGVLEKAPTSPIYTYRNPSEKSTSSGITMDQVYAALSNRKPLHGFERILNNILLFDKDAKNFSILGVDFGVWFSGVQYLKNDESITVNIEANIPSIWFVYYDNELILMVDSSWDCFSAIPICIIYWDGSDYEIEDHRHPVFTDFDAVVLKKIPLRIPVINNDTPTIINYQSIYASIYGENPDVRLVIEQEDGSFHEDAQRPYFTYESNSLLDTVYFDCGYEVNGYILIK